MTEMIGQILGGVAVVLGFLSYQVKTAKRLLLMQLLTSVVFCVHYGLIGAIVGMGLNAIAAVRNLTYFYCNQKQYRARWVPILFTVVIIGVGFFTWEAWYSVFCVVALAVNTYCMSFTNPQNVRRSILVTSPMVLVYDAFAFSIGGIVYESVAILSAAIGLGRYRKKSCRFTE